MCVLFLALIWGHSVPVHHVPARGQATEANAEWERALEAELDALLAQMSVADRVGQLFLITFPGADTGFESDIAELIHGYRVGGVILTARMGNFTNQSNADTPRAVASLANRLQALAYGFLLPLEVSIPNLDDVSAVYELLPEPIGGLEPAVEAALLAALRAEGEETTQLPRLEELTGVPALNLPLFIAVEQAGDHLPHTTLRRGFTPLPSQMALGATWNPELTRRTGAILGHELSAVGVNLLLGPSLNVIEPPRPDAVGSLGLNSFGGAPYWVAQHARAYIAGVYEGSGGRVATVARDFPGAGDIDRLPHQEIATVQRSLAHLRRQALPPFWAVTRRPAATLAPGGDPATTAALMSSPTRYSAFQGGSSGRATPLNLTPELEAVLEQEGMAAWNERGILVSPPLGLPSIRRYYSPTQEEFPYRRIALDAFTAGHDLLVLDYFSPDGQWETQMRNIQATIGFFQERYINDPAFAQEVDESVRRILRLKLGQHGYTPRGTTTASPALPLDRVWITESILQRLNNEHRAAALAVVTQVARESLTTLYPDGGSTAEALSLLPQIDEKIVVFSDSRLFQECYGCLAEPAIGPDDLAGIMLRLYGPGATGQLAPDQIISLSFADLAEALDRPPTAQPSETTFADLPPDAGSDGDLEDAEPLLDKVGKINLHLAEAEWILFAMLDVDEERYPHSSVVKRFLRERSDTLVGKQIVVFALHAPYFLDATEISKLHAYYGVYSKTPPFLENAIRGLFRSYTPAGAPPVSVPGTRFAALPERTQPDPARPIDLRILDPEGAILAERNGDDGAGAAALEAGIPVRVQAGPFYDVNGKVLHDGFSVEFTLVYEGDDGATRQETAVTRGGLATRELVLDRGGALRIYARAGGAVSEPPLAVTVLGGETPETVTGAEDGAPNEEADSGEDLPPVEEAGPVIVAGNGDGEPGLDGGRRITLASFIVSMLFMAGVLGILLVVQVRVLPRRVVVQGALWSIVCGLGAYILYGVGLAPFGGWLENSLRVWGAVVVVLIAMLPPLVWIGLRSD